MPPPPIQDELNEAREEILGHLTRKIKGEKAEVEVEDTRLKAKYTKKSDAKTKDQLCEHRDPLKKKGLRINFSEVSKKKISSIIRHFQGLVGFEAKVKDFKMCPREPHLRGNGWKYERHEYDTPILALYILILFKHQKELIQELCCHDFTLVDFLTTRF